MTIKVTCKTGGRCGGDGERVGGSRERGGKERREFNETVNRDEIEVEETKRELMKEQSNAEMSGAKVVEELRERVRVLQALMDSEDGDVAEAMSIRGSDDTNERGEGEED